MSSKRSKPSPQPPKNFEAVYNEKTQRYRLYLCDRDIYPLEIIAPNGIKRIAHYKEKGKKGPSLFINSV